MSNRDRIYLAIAVGIALAGITFVVYASLHGWYPFPPELR